MSEAIAFGAAAGLACAVVFLVLAAIGYGALVLLRQLARAIEDDDEASEDLATCRAIDALGVTKRPHR